MENQESNGGKSHREMLVAFYKQHNPSKVEDVDNLLQKYSGKEDKLFRSLAKKYSVDAAQAFGIAQDDDVDSGMNAGDGSSSPIKPTFLLCSAEPDVKIIVGGQEYKEYGPAIRCWSKYFDRALASGMKEGDTLEFSFAERDPKQWEWIISLMSPMSKEKVNMDTLLVALDWFDFLCCNIGLEECDRVLSTHLQPSPFLSPPHQKVPTPEHLSRIMTYIEKASKYNLKASKAMCFKMVRLALVNDVTLFTKDYLQIIATLVKDTVECHSQFIGPLKAHLPSSISEEQAEVLLQNDMLPDLVHLEIERLRKQKEEDQAKKRLVLLVAPYPKIRKNFKQDDIWGTVFPDGWAD